MLNHSRAVSLLGLAVALMPLWGQAPPLVESGAKPAFVIPDLNGPNGLELAPSRNLDGTLLIPSHTGYFQFGFSTGLRMGDRRDHSLLNYCPNA